jgi:hypothetical protein
VVKLCLSHSVTTHHSYSPIVTPAQPKRQPVDHLHRVLPSDCVFSALVSSLGRRRPDSNAMSQTASSPPPEEAAPLSEGLEPLPQAEPSPLVPEETESPPSVVSGASAGPSQTKEGTPDVEASNEELINVIQEHLADQGHLHDATDFDSPLANDTPELGLHDRGGALSTEPPFAVTGDHRGRHSENPWGGDRFNRVVDDWSVSSRASIDSESEPDMSVSVSV